MQERIAVSEPEEPEEHRISTVERGSFVNGVCSCGWRGPARRAREKAREDAEAHLET